jgi:AmmeMemoRadiSam system protein A
MIDAADRALLLRLARNAIAAHVTGVPPQPLAPSEVEGAEESDILARRGGVFVSLHQRRAKASVERGDLRGCIGHIAADLRLDQVIPQSAVASCSRDPRFKPIGRSELDDIDIELSLLGPLEPIGGPDDIEIGRHGLLVEQGHRRGLLLPQVAVEWKWDAPAFLAQTCRKAGLPADAWKRADNLWRFEAEVFGEATVPTVDR